MCIQIIEIILKVYIYTLSSLLYVCLHVGTHLLADTRVKEDGKLFIQIAVQMSVRIMKCLLGGNSCTSKFLKYQLQLCGTGYHNGNSLNQKKIICISLNEIFPYVVKEPFFFFFFHLCFLEKC